MSGRFEKLRVWADGDVQQGSSGVQQQQQYSDMEQIALPHKARLYQLFEYVEKEIDSLYEENCELQTKLNQLSERLGETVTLSPEVCSSPNDPLSARKEVGRKGNQMRQKLKTALRVPPGRLVQSLKVVSDSSRRCRYVRSFMGHRDGIWHVTASRGSQPILASASADQTCLLWSLDAGSCLAQYTGHVGSVNGVAFGPSTTDSTEFMLATASGDRTAHIWKTVVPGNTQLPAASSEDDELAEKEQTNGGNDMQGSGEIHASSIVRQPLRRLTGHANAVMAVEWFSGGEQLITASWDRTANIYDAERGEILNILSGHDDELNHCNAHPSQKLIVTASRDSTFRLWDFRESIQSVAVFQGHIDSVTSVVFSSGEKLVSGSDDRSIKVWDLRNMRSAIVTVRLDSAVNRISISSRSVVAIPQDNRSIRLYDLNTVRLTRLPRASGQSHRRIVCCTAWADDHPNYDLFTCGFDKQVIAWKTAFAKE
ncbi:WD-repeat protein 37 [Loa loa]|uniref:WD repeat-containing protein 37 n=2 Tax=Loa loa TaxID=7209 RepID=A0A1I7VU93_LOALO|nr:WD-repeat protein 37 [Loa loa]EFO25027.1 WD-repeat protein 37 [Loa loa]